MVWVSHSEKINHLKLTSSNKGGKKGHVSPSPPRRCSSLSLGGGPSSGRPARGGGPRTEPTLVVPRVVVGPAAWRRKETEGERKFASGDPSNPKCVLGLRCPLEVVHLP